MKRFHPSHWLFAILFSILAFSSAPAQFAGQVQDVNDPPPPAQRPNLLRELNLSKNQIQQIRRLNQERRPVMQESQRRLREANRALDEAIYADTENDAEIQARVKEAQLAQAELIKNRTITELAIRKLLTPEQLARFRNLRAEFMQTDNPRNRPLNRRNSLRNIPRRTLQRPPQNPPPRRP